MRTPKHPRVLQGLLATAAILICGAVDGSLFAGKKPTTQAATQPTTFPRPGTFDRELAVSAASADGAQAASRDALWPDSLTFTRDNAAPLYLAGMIQMPSWADPKLQEVELRLMDATPDDINAAEADEYLDKFQRTFQMIGPAVHRPRIEWDWPWHEQGYMTLLPHLNQMRYIGNALRFGVKLDLSRGDFASALRRIKQGQVMGIHTGAHDEAVYVEGLVGAGLAGQATENVVLVVARPGAPNLYHALMALPDPAYRPRIWVEMEHRMFRESVPLLFEPERMDETAWVQVWRQFAHMGLSEHGWQFNDMPGEEQNRIAREVGASRREAMVPAAVAWLAERGDDEAALREEAGRNPYPLLARYMTGTMDEYMDEAAALVQLPLDETFPRLRALAEEAKAVEWWRESDLTEPNFDTLAPNFHRGLLSVERLRQRIAALVVLEALRDHAAAHGGWPDSLEQLRLYAPPDPFTGHPFEYRRDGEAFVLRGVTRQHPESGFEWRVRLREE